MIDQNILRQNPAYVEEMLKRRNIVINVSDYLRMDEERKMIQVETEKLQSERNNLAKAIGFAKANGNSTADLLQKASVIPKRINELSNRLHGLQKRIFDWLSQIPNLPSDDVVEGKDEISIAQTLTGKSSRC